MPKIHKPTAVGTISRSLELPDGYQHFDFPKTDGTHLDTSHNLRHRLKLLEHEELYLYTQHQIFYEDGLLKHTRSSPNWDGGVVTFSTCKHLMRTYKRETWKGVWLAGLCPKDCANNTLLFCGRVDQEFCSNFELSHYLRDIMWTVYQDKQADTNPRGDLYSPDHDIDERGMYNHTYYKEPKNHTRSIEFYKKSPGSVSDRSDGKIPKWWRDIEYINRGRRPPCFILSPCYIFSKPTLWTSYKPRRAVLHITAGKLAASLSLGQ